DEGMTLQNICDTLNLKGIPSSKGRKWIPTTLIGQLARKTGLLRQSLYKGIVTFNRMAYRKHPDTGRRLSFLRPEKDWLKIPIPELALFEESYFDGVQKKVEARSTLRKQRVLLNKVLNEDEKAAQEARMEKRRRQKQAKVRKLPTYIVSGRLVCADHNEAMKIGRVKLYNCPNRKCENRNLRLGPVDN
ncbi:MAG: recombinase family protein, partial [Magnetovibrio sp.]|nr:recombinase family protein [Magnetovibrio sp.]